MNQNQRHGELPTSSRFSSSLPCGRQTRVSGSPRIPGTLHVTEIREDAELHYHKRLTETYVFLECGS